MMTRPWIMSALVRWKQRAAMVSALSSPTVPRVVIMTSCGVTNADWIGIRPLIRYKDAALPVWEKRHCNTLYNAFLFRKCPFKMSFAKERHPNRASMWQLVNNLIDSIQRLHPITRDYIVYEFSQWETTLHCNAVSHWLNLYTEWSTISGSKIEARSIYVNKEVGCPTEPVLILNKASKFNNHLCR